jgi:phosphonate transport system substrate-binding protein
MNSRDVILSLCAALPLFLAACSNHDQVQETDPDTFSLARAVVALKPDKNPDRMLAEKSALERFLSGQIGRPVEVIIPLAPSVILEGLANGTIDLAYVSATEMIMAADRGAAAVLAVGEINGRTTYQSYWVALKEKPYQTVKELQGKPVAFASRTSTSGRVIPQWDLVRQGLLPEGGDPELFFGQGNVHYGSGYVSAIDRVLRGEAEAAAVSYYVLDENRHLTEEQRDRLRKVTEQGPVPTHVIAVRSGVSPRDREILQRAIFALNSPEHEALRDKVFTSRLVTVNPQEHLAPLRQALALTGSGTP